MISAPRYGSATPNPSGEWAVFSTSTYSFEEHEGSSQWKLMRLDTGEISDLPFADEVSEILWVGNTPTSVLYVNSTSDTGGISLWTVDLAHADVAG